MFHDHYHSSIILLMLATLANYVQTATLDNHYCQLKCDFVVHSYEHTVCNRTKEECGAGEKCGADFREINLSNADRQYILDIHNYLRNKVASGDEKHGLQPSSSNMRAMKYNKELENIAQCWSNTCNGHPLIHDKCRRTQEFEHVGQNLGFVNSSEANIDLVKSIKELILFWYNEVEIFDSKWVIETQDRGPATKVGHYTQMLWADTTDVGCAATYYTSQAGAWHHLVFVCNYGPGGNYIGLPVYKMGHPASECPSGLARNTKYPGLCGETARVKHSLLHANKSDNNVFQLWRSNKKYV